MQCGGVWPGGIGLNVIQELRMIGANMIVGVDLNNKKRNGAKNLE